MYFKERIKSFIESKQIDSFILILIIFNGITLGIETSKSLTQEQLDILHIIDQTILCIFVAEILAKMTYQGVSFFKAGWNIFDFLIVGIALFPSSGPLAILRALRILRVRRLLSIIPQMRMIILALFQAIPGMYSIVDLISLIFYISAVLATNLFGATFDTWFGTIGRSLFSLFQIMTLESWSMGIARPVMDVYPYAWVFFVPFILVTSFAVINLFIGVIVNSMGSISEDGESRDTLEASNVDTKLDLINRELAGIRLALENEQKRKQGQP